MKSKENPTKNDKQILRNRWILALLSIVILATIQLNHGCSEPAQAAEKVRVNKEYASYVKAYTSGLVKRHGTIRIELTDDFAGVDPTTDVPDQYLFELTPHMEGEVRWVTGNTIEFEPDEPFTSGQDYQVDFQLGELVDVPEEFEVFSFNFSTLVQGLQVYTEGFTYYDQTNLKDQKLSGKLVTADQADVTMIKKCLTAYQDGKKLDISWNNRGGLDHEFTVEHVQRKEKASEVKLEWNGVLIGSEEQGKEVLEVPALGDFKITRMEVVHEPEQFIRILFSDPLKGAQNLEGIITVDEISDLTYNIEGNELQVYLPFRVSGTRTVTINPGVRNINGYKMINSDAVDLVFEGIKPDVKLVGEGTIIPTTARGMLFPFEAVNLSAVDVYITKVYENNIIQFLQVNDLDEHYEMRRVAKEVMRKRVSLRKDGRNLHVWNRFNLNLSDIIKVDPGAIYQVELRFKKEYSLYRCDGDESDELTEITFDEEEDWNEDDWTSYDYWYDYDYWEYGSYDYSERENPCDHSYYRNKKVKSNMLASDIGIVAKAGTDKVMHIFLNDLRSTAPLAGSRVEFYDYQQQLLGSAVTNERGMTSVKLKRKPFVVVAKRGQQRGYLKLRDGESLSLSKFDVAGATIQKDVKGYIYAERGVWRPGDSIYTTFILEDKNKVLPKNHPVTFLVEDPHGNVIEKKVISRNVRGMYDFRTATSQEAPTGNYYATVKVGNREYTKTLKVETVKPNRLKIELDFAKELLAQGDRDSEGKVAVRWLHGATAGNLKTKIDMTVYPRRTKFDKHPNFIFDDPLKSFSSETQRIFDNVVDDDGYAKFKPEISIGNVAPGMLTANFITTVFEKGGGFSIDRHSIPYSPYKSYVGIRVPEGSMAGGALETDQDIVVDVASLTAEGTPLSRKKLEVKMYKVSWRWWWDSYDNDLASYIAKSSTVPIMDQTISTNNGKGSFVIRVDRPEWGRYVVQVTDPVSGHSTGKVIYIDWPYWARSSRTNVDNATMLSFSTDKEVYKTGEQVKISFPSASNGRAIVALESGTKVVKKMLVKTTKGETKVTFTTTKAMAPNVFVHITLLQPHDVTGNDLPIRMYGVAPITVENPHSHLNPTIKTEDVFRPETQTAVTVAEQNGKPMTYTLAIVDDGLLDLTNFKTPNPWDHFYAREALGVKTWDMYDDVMGAFGLEMQALLAIGGDGSGAMKKPNKANRFKPMVRFVGPFHLPAGSRKTHKIDIPNYVGSVRVMVVAGENGAYGRAEKTVPVKSPLMVLGTLPRVLGPKERVFLPVNVFAMEDQVKTVTVDINTNDKLKILGSSHKTMRFAKTGDEVINFELEVLEEIGIGEVEIIAKSGSHIAKYRVELDVRTPNPSVADVYEAVLDPGESWDKGIEFKGIRGTNSATIELSTFPPLNLDQRLKYLIRYPHGCIEQTTSAAFPQLALHRIMDLNANFKASIDRNVVAALQRLQLFQTSEGGFGYWPGNTTPDEWGSNYAGHFMLEAEARGYNISSSIKKRWVQYQKNTAKAYRPMAQGSRSYYHRGDQNLIQAYRLYTLALAGSPELGAMNRLRETNDLSATSKWRLAAAYSILGQTEVAETLIRKLPKHVKEYKELSYTYGSNIRDEAMILETLVQMKHRESAAVMAKRIAEHMNSKEWMSTQTTAYCLLAINKFLGELNADKTMRFTYSIAGTNQVTKNTQVPVFKADLKDFGGVGTVKLKNRGEGMLYAKVVVEGTPVIGDQSGSQSNLTMGVEYTALNGRSLDPSELEQGTDFIAVVTIHNPGSRGDLEEMALNQIFPSGWEIHNDRMNGSTMDHSTMDYQDIRDDRIYTYFDISRGSTKTYKVKLNATYLGRFYLPTIESEAMYDQAVNARVPGRWVEVVPKKDKLAMRR